MALIDTIARLPAPADSAVGRRRTLARQVVAQHTFICTLPGHAEAGMTGAAFVTP